MNRSNIKFTYKINKLIISNLNTSEYEGQIPVNKESKELIESKLNKLSALYELKQTCVFKKAKQLNNNNIIGLCYYSGLGIKLDKHEAYKLFSKDKTETKENLTSRCSQTSQDDFIFHCLTS